MTLKLVVIQKRHDRKNFDCGYQALNQFLARSARTSSDKRMTRTYVLEASQDPDTVIGFVTLTYTSIEIPDECRPGRNLKSPVPALLLAKMGVSKQHKGQGYGKHLLTFAIKQAAEVSNQVGGVGLVVDAKDQKAKSFYLDQGGEDFEVIDDTGLKLWLPIDICNAIAQATL
ncbi:GNAT family N-acetyltransferase [Marinobacter zhanjiangensis]|uniref:Acetyltransferase n=1 Tax=Marinobacter zhanjiangensis TaxID=578215 RepID=A0ABQ3AT75_9GAMM|nr:GNAT family N-acetyltransferase [Marinobacter zhanjiangensis]GGY63261.1 acetyltransferase [Marinobacter zhanjiangensis]